MKVAFDRSRARRLTLDWLHAIVLVLSVLLILVISVDTFKSVPFLESRLYMRFQLVVCLVFIADFFVELWLQPAGGRASFWRRRWLFLLLSVPYLNIIGYYNIEMSPDALYFIRFVPLARGVLALVIVLEYIVANRITGMFVSYLSILTLTIYFAALVFYEREQPVNPGVTSFFDALWWCFMQATTMGCSLVPVTVAGKVLSFVVSFMGLIMFPLFTVYLTSLIIKRRSTLNIIKKLASSVKSDISDDRAGRRDNKKVASQPKNH